MSETNAPLPRPRRAFLRAAALALVGATHGRAIAQEPARTASPYRVEFSYPIRDLIGDLETTERGDPRLEAATPHREWYSREVLRRFGAWGPSPRHYPTVPGLEQWPVERRRERVIAVALRYVGYGYQHHHVPDWDPPADWPWKETAVGRNGKGVDCSNFTGFVYNQGFGIRLNTDVHKQAEQSRAEEGQGRSIPLRRVELPPGFEDRARALRTGDLLYIRGREDGPITHVVLWVGPIGKSREGAPLVLDSHGAGVKDDEGRTIPAGVQLRPFREKSWYNRCASHAYRVIPDAGE